MGGEYNTRIYEGKLSKDKVRKMAQDTTDEMNYEDGSGSYSGHWGVKNGGIDFCSTTFATENDAENWLADNNDKWGNIGACYFDNQVGTKAQRTRVDKLNVKLNELNSNHTVLVADVEDISKGALTKMKSIKSKTKGCKACGARHIVRDLTSTTCKCGVTLLSDTEVKRIANAETKARTKVAKSYEKIQKDTQTLSELKAKIGIVQGWLVGGWCSC